MLEQTKCLFSGQRTLSGCCTPRENIDAILGQLQVWRSLQAGVPSQVQVHHRPKLDAHGTLTTVVGRIPYIDIDGD
jgi:hypothetical protein